MTVRVYFDPIVRVTREDGVFRIPKYFYSPMDAIEGIHGPRSMMAHGYIDLAIVVADVSLTDHQFLFDQTDVLSIDPRNGDRRNLDEIATQAEINALTSYLDNANSFVPMGWATTSDTRRAIIRGVCCMFQFSLNLSIVANYVPANQLGFALNTQWSQLTSEQQGWFLDAAARLGFSSQVPGPNNTVRQILKFMADAWGTREVYLGALGAL